MLRKMDKPNSNRKRKMNKLKHEQDEVPHTSPALPSAQVKQPKLQPTVSNNNRCFLHFPPDLTQPKEITYNSYELKPKVDSSDYFDSPSAKSIGKFFSEAGPQPGVLHSSSLKEMVVFPHGPGVVMPTYESVLQEQLRETENRAMELRQEWQTSGCSVIVDNWKSKCGNSFVSVLVYCSKGMQFLRSIDVSAITEGWDELKSMLFQMFSSPEWVSSSWSCLGLFERIQSIVKRDDAFWHAAAEVLKVTNPLVSVLYKLESDICPMGILYEAMDSAKEDIFLNLGYESYSYWRMIDEIWNDYLHSHLHAAGYVLNPRIFYTDKFHLDTEVSNGIAGSTIQLGKAHYNPLKASEQLEVYKKKLGYFDTDPAMQQIMEMPQVQWWSTHGARVPDLQTLARRILSQTCFGATRYNIDWSLSEKLHADWPEMTPPEQERFRQREYIHYNRILAHSAPCLDGTSVKQHDRVTLVLQDWIREQK